MKAKEKAKELVHKFMPHADKKARPSSMGNFPAQGSGIASLLSNQSGITYNTRDLFNSAKQCALIAVDEILDVLGSAGIYGFADNKVTADWEDVKVEIKKLKV